MSTSPMLSGYTDFTGLHELKARASKDQSGESLEAAAKQFESMFVQLMMKSMRDANATMKSGLFDNAGTDMFEEMLDKEFSVQFGQRGAFGLAEMLVKQLGQMQPARSASGSPMKADDRFPLNPETSKLPLPSNSLTQVPLAEQVLKFRSLGHGGDSDE